MVIDMPTFQIILRAMLPWDIMLVSHNSRRGSPIGHVAGLTDEIGMEKGVGGPGLTEQSVQLLQSVQSCRQS